MVRDINSLGSLHETRAKPANSRPAASPAPEQRAEVQLSSQAQTLQGLENKLQHEPEVNEARVEAIKQALADGNYKIDDLVVADKLIQADGLFR